MTTRIDRAWMQTYSGNAVHPLNPDPSTIASIDIAHALSNICRYGGHTPYHYSVAQHSLYVAALLSPEDQLDGLLHDAGEAYLGDMIRPIKEDPRLATYDQYERRMLDTIYEALDISMDWPLGRADAVKWADNVVLASEAHAMFPEARRPSPWTLPEPRSDAILVAEAGNPTHVKNAFMRALVHLQTGGSLQLANTPDVWSEKHELVTVIRIGRTDMWAPWDVTGYESQGLMVYRKYIDEIFGSYDTWLETHPHLVPAYLR